MKGRNSFAINMAFVALSTAACSGGQAPASSLTVDGSKLVSMNETRVFLRPGCIISGNNPEVAPFLITLANILFPVLIDKTFDVAASAARKAGEAKTTEIPASGSGSFYRVVFNDSDVPQNLSRNGDLGCITIISAPFGVTANGPQYSSETWKRIASNPQQEIALRRLGIAGDPTFYFESWVRFSQDLVAFRLEPQRMIYLSNFEKGWVDRDGVRDLVLDFSFRVPNRDKQEGQVFAHSLLVFRDLHPGLDLSAPHLSGKLSDWMPLAPIEEKTQQIMSASVNRVAAVSNARALKDALDKRTFVPPPRGSLAFRKKELETRLASENDQLLKLLASDESAKKAVEQRRIISNTSDEIDAINSQLAHEDLKKTTDASIRALESEQKAARNALSSFSPFNLTATVRETKDANKYLLFFADVLNQSNDGLKAAAKENIVPSERSRVRNSRDDAADQLLRAALEALNKVDEAQAAVDNSGDISVLEKQKLLSSLRIAKFDVNIAYRKAGRQPPFPDAVP